MSDFPRIAPQARRNHGLPWICVHLRRETTLKSKGTAGTGLEVGGSMRFLFRLGFVMALSGVALQGQVTLPVRFTAFAIDVNNMGKSHSGTVDIKIDRWSSDAERDALVKTFMEKGPQKLLDALQDAKSVGYIKTPQTLAWDLRFARQIQLDEGVTQILLLTDRPIGFAEARNQPRTIDYPFTLIDLRIKKDGTGVGKASVATKIIFNKKKNVVELENYSSEPVRLNNIKIEK